MIKNLFKNLINFVNKNKFYIIAFLIFLLVRVYVLTNFPRDYSDVRHDYERYANMWWYGVPPYFKHLYEYPPATIPLLIIPLAFDQAKLGIYYFNYRIQIFIIETILYFFILKALKITHVRNSLKYTSIIFYNIAPLIAKAFWYEGIDLALIASLTIAIITFLMAKKTNFMPKLLFWSLFWLSVALKFVTFPLILAYFLIRKMDIKKELLAIMGGLLIIWGLPLAIFRSSLSVSLYFHATRPLHASSFPAFIIYTLNHFTNSEKMISLEWFGPLSQKALFWSFIFLLVNTAIVIFWTLKRLLTDKKINAYVLMLRTSIIYLIVFALSGKIFSPPFNIWFVPLLTIFPYKNLKQQILFFTLGVWSLIYNTTNIADLSNKIMIYPFTWNYLRTLLRFPPLILIIFFMISLNFNSLLKKQGKN